MVVVGADLVDQRLLLGPVAQPRVEDLHLWNFLSALSHRGLLQHPVDVIAGGDPPDKVVTSGESTFAVELTDLTWSRVRPAVAEARRVGRLVADRLTGAPDTYPHLRGLAVHVQGSSQRPERLSAEAVADEIAAVLREDKGAVGDGMDLSAGPPPIGTQMLTSGNYGDVLGYHVLVQHPWVASAVDSPPVVIAGSQSGSSLSEARQALYDRVAAKDRPENRVLLITAAGIDNAGYRTLADSYLFSLLRDHGVGTLPEPEHLDAVIVHLYGTADLLMVFERPGQTQLWGSAAE